MTGRAPVLFYRRAGPGASERDPPELPEGLHLRCWVPGRDGPPRGVFATRSNRLWWWLDRIGGFARDGLTAFAVVDGERVLHRLLVTPRWYRFPDMAVDDLQMGDLWTDPAHRGRGLAAATIGAVHRAFAGRYGSMWYLVDADNAASRAVIERFGYTLVGTGVRTRPLGIGAVGRFRMRDRSAAG